MTEPVNEPGPAPPDSSPGSALGSSPGKIVYSRVLDLSRPIHPAMPVWPGDPAVQFETTASLDPAPLDQQGYFLRRFTMGEHTGTHLSAPSCFYADGPTIDTYAPESLVAPAVVIDLLQKALKHPDYAVSRRDLGEWEVRHGRILDGSVVLARTGWGEKWDDPSEYLGNYLGECLGQKTGSGLHFPGFGIDAARFLLEQRGIAGLGIDTHGVDPGQDSSFAVSKLLLEQPRIVLANLTGLEQLPPTGTTLVIGILRLRGGIGDRPNSLRGWAKNPNVSPLLRGRFRGGVVTTPNLPLF